MDGGVRGPRAPGGARTGGRRPRPLARSGLLAREGEAFRLRPRRAGDAELVARLAELYPTYRVAIVSIIFSRPSGPIRDFSDAFRLRDED